MVGDNLSLFHLLCQRNKNLLLWHPQLNVRNTSNPPGGWTWFLLFPWLCCCSKAETEHSRALQVLPFAEDIGTSDSRALHKQLLPLPEPVLPSVIHPTVPSHHSSSSSRLILQVTMFFLCNTKPKHFFFLSRQVFLCCYMILYLFVFLNERCCNLRYRRFLGGPTGIKGLVTVIWGMLMQK